jgi:dephospho-CoA kinase
MKSIRIGIAGFTGSGKSTAARLLADICRTSFGGVLLIDADSQAKEFMLGSVEVKERLAARFGHTVAWKTGISFAELGDKAFSSYDNLCALNGIVHPAFLTGLKSKVMDSGQKCVICDAALIPLWKIEKWFDRLIWVRASDSERLSRLLKKTGLDKDSISARMAMQQRFFNEPESLEWNIIDNNGTIEDLEKSVLLFSH